MFDVWTKEEHLAKWWGPQGFTTNFHKFEMKPGGTLEFIMYIPDSVDFPNTNVFAEIVKSERIVFKHTVFPHFVATASFEELDGKTKLTYCTVFEESAATFDQVKTYAAPSAEQTRLFIENGIDVSEAHTCEDTLEDYFKKIAEGVGIA